ncbi:MAG: orotidine 5'-phosphate decarboxylase [Candidatus Dependentiae bacterium]|nr:orotidine 5'-phosphate decarboxylase [Candidatus Dependentiae bacterium]
MKLQISFDMPDLDKALAIATLVAPHADVLEVGTLLIYLHGVKAVTAFKNAFPKKTILADCKIADRAKEAVTHFAQAGADWVTVMAGTGKDVIHAACSTAENLNIKVMLDLIDASSLGQSALEAKNLGVNALLFHQPYDEQESLTFLDKWDMIKGNTDVPVFISAKIRRDTIEEIINIKPYGLAIGKSIVEAENPAQEAQYFYDLCSKN